MTCDNCFRPRKLTKFRGQNVCRDCKIDIQRYVNEKLTPKLNQKEELLNQGEKYEHV